ncbi:hypothetical protein O3P69_004700 [Scylla paramamosain]|uniref:Mariner Mos1 transposase n=1 Tax=Scylla paramamosain TaxID=85552 RepID=A0AAW0UAU8_SCYPA
MPHRMTLSSTGIISSCVVGHRWKRPPIPGRPQSAINEDTIRQVEAAILEDRRITKQERVQCSQSLLTMCQESQEEFFDRLITQDETWVHHYDPETKTQSKKHYDSPPPKNARAQPSAGNVMLTVFLGPAQSSDDGFPGKEYHNYRDVLRFTAA